MMANTGMLVSQQRQAISNKEPGMDLSWHQYL